MVALSVFDVVVAASCLSGIVGGFVVVPNTDIITRTPTTSYATQLYGRRMTKRGILGSIDDDDDDDESGSTTKAATTPRRSMKQQRKAASTRKKKGSNKSGTGSTSSAMSPDLAQFLEQSGDNIVEVEVVKGKSSSRPSKRERQQNQSVQKLIDEEQSAKIETVLDKLEEVLGERTGNVRDILTIVEELLDIPSNNSNDLRRLLSARDRSDYRLAWAGGDEAICHIGTGLHKVPLARMQEVFMNCLGKNKIEVLEVISVFGPFPNVKNVLQGTTKIMSENGGSDVQIVMDSMFDGTGREIMAGNDDNIRRVDLQVAFCHERVIVALMPPDDDSANAKPLDDDGKRVLLFLKEDDLDDKLEELRVNELD